MANIMITKRCNLSCPYCFANDYVNDGSQNFDIDMASFNEILEFILRDGSQKKIGLIGGEPTVHPQFEDILRTTAAVEQLLCVTVYTNGILIDKYLDTLSDPKFKLLINCNDLSFSKELTDRFTQSYEAAYACMKERVTPGVNFYKPDFDFSYAVKLLEKYHYDKVRVSISVPNSGYSYDPLSYFSAVKARVIDFFMKLKQIGTIPFFDCNIFPACLLYFDDVEAFSEWGSDNPFFNIKSRQTGCLPVVDILPDKTAIRCFGLSEYTGENIKDFACITDLINYYLRTVDAYAINTVYDEKCSECYKFKTMKCSGGCLVYKIDKIISQRKGC